LLTNQICDSGMRFVVGDRLVARSFCVLYGNQF